MKKLSMDDKLAKNRFESDDEVPHIVIDRKACTSCSHKSCIYSCPAERYRLSEEGNLLFDHVGCLECGNCRLVCERLMAGLHGYSWNYPRDGKGIVYRQG